MIQHYCVGFLLRNDDKEVALIRKIKPDWQAGKLNGIGRNIRGSDTPQHANPGLRREVNGFVYFARPQVLQ